MNYLYILFPFIVWLISQTIKFLVRLTQHKVPLHLKDAFWVYVWAGGAPSTHTAILTSSLFLIWHNYGLSPILTFCIVITMLWLYDMTAQKKKQELMDSYLLQSGSEPLKKSVTDGYLLDLSGHGLGEIVWGMVLGFILGVLASHWL